MSEEKGVIKSFGAYECARESLSTYGGHIDNAIGKHRVHFGDKHILSLLYAFVAMGGEVGEALNEVKKWIREDEFVWTEDRKVKMALELGDILWYLSACCQEMGFKLEDVATANIAKLRERRARDDDAAK